MTDKFQYFPGPVYPVPPQPGTRPGQGPKPRGPSFATVLDGQLHSRRPVQFSRHAQARMESRGIRFDAAEMARLETAVQSVQAKGGRDSLVMLGDNALVVSVKNSTVVTVVDQDSLNGNVFTNIDSAVIA